MSDVLQPIVDEVVRRVLAELAKQKPANDVEYLSTTDAAELASVTQATIRRWVKDGKLPAFHAGRHVRVRRTDLERLLSDTPTGTESPEELVRRVRMGR